jgi:flagellar hook-basal body complex protein FliE
MDPLSALKMFSGSGLSASPLGGAGGAGGAGALTDITAKSIPLSELQKLNPDSAAQAIGNSPSSTAAASGIGNTETGGSFSNLLGNFVGEVNAQQTAAGDAISGLMSGKNVSLHQAMISMEEASVSFQMMVEVRNKLLDSYQELMRMQI